MEGVVDISTVCIVTPVFNGEDYIDDTISSVLMQSGSFSLKYHIQDGGSSDKTIEIIKKWKRLHESGDLPVLCKSLEFTWTSEKDTGMYNAINRAFSRVLPESQNVVMGWINADDRLAQGGLETVVQILAQFPDVRFLGGRVSLLDSNGSILGVGLPRTYSRPCMAAGLYDGRSLPFVMQEGTFWTRDLWTQAGGKLDERFRLAGDWDLWRRFAQFADYFSVDSVLGFHRRRPGQLSGEMDKYYAEVDRIIRQDGPSHDHASDDEPVTDLLKEYERLLFRHEEYAASPHSASVIRFNLNQRTWEKLGSFGLPVAPPTTIDRFGAVDGIPIFPVHGFNPPEGPYPEWGMPFGVRWMSGFRAEGEITLTVPGWYSIVLHCRSWTKGQVVTVSTRGRSAILASVTSKGNERELILKGTVYLPRGSHIVEICIENTIEPNGLLLVTSWYAEPIRSKPLSAVTPVASELAPIATSATSLLFGMQWPRISVVVPTRNQGLYIRDTLSSIIRQGYPNLELIVIDGGSSDETMEIVREFAPHISYYVSEPDRGQSHAINKGFSAASGEILTWLNSDDILAKGALHTVAFAFMLHKPDLVAGTCEVFNATNMVIHKHIPTLNDGFLPFDHLLDIKNNWLKGQFFHQPEVFFSRGIFEKAGGFVSEDLYYSMDYDLWVRMAAVGARIHIIGRTIALYRMHNQQKTSTVEAYLPELLEHSGNLQKKYNVKNEPEKILKNRLTIIFFNDYGFKYGAGVAHRRLAQALELAGHDIHALAVADFDTETRPSDFSRIYTAITDLKPDLIVLGNLHAADAGAGLLKDILELNIPTIYFAHDQWIITGRCAYVGKCIAYRDSCTDECPTASLYPSLAAEAINEAFTQKRSILKKHLAGGKLRIATNSRFMKAAIDQQLSDKDLPEATVLPLGIDTRLFTHGQRNEARLLLGLPVDKFIVLTGATNISDERKGLSYLIEALNLQKGKGEILLVILGYGNELPGAPCEVRFTGYLSQEQVTSLYFKAADIFVGPSIEEALGQTFIEAGACGTPSIAFDVGGISDAIVDGITGLLVSECSAKELAEAIAKLRSDTGLRRQMGANAVMYARDSFSLEKAAAAFSAMLLRCEDSFQIGFTPCVTLRTGNPKAIPVRYLFGKGSVSSLDHIGIFLLSGLSAERGEETHPFLPAEYWWVTERECRIAVHAQESQNARLEIYCRKVVSSQQITVQFNSCEEVTFNIEGGGFDTLHKLVMDVFTTDGLNCISLRFSDALLEAGSSRSLFMLIEKLELVLKIDETYEHADGDVEVLEGFSYVEGPYPEHGLFAPFRWVTSPICKIRLYNRVSGKKRLFAKIRNYHPEQSIRFMVDGNEIAFLDKISALIKDTTILVGEINLSSGYHIISLSATKISDADSAGRTLAFAFEDAGILFDDVEQPQIKLTNDNSGWLLKLFPDFTGIRHWNNVKEEGEYTEVNSFYLAPNSSFFKFFTYRIQEYKGQYFFEIRQNDVGSVLFSMLWGSPGEDEWGMYHRIQLVHIGKKLEELTYETRMRLSSLIIYSCESLQDEEISSNFRDALSNASEMIRISCGIPLSD